MSQVSPASQVPCGSRAVAVFVLVLLVGAVGAQTMHSLERMAAGLTVQDTVSVAPRRHHDEVRSAGPMQFATCAQRMAGRTIRVCSVSAAMWPPPRGPDPSLR